MLARRVVEHEVHEHANATLVRFRHEALEILVGSVLPVDLVVIRDVVAVIARRFGDRHQPDARGAKVAAGAGLAVVDVIELLDETLQIADAVAITVVERADEYLVADPAVPPIPRRGNSTGNFRPSGFRAGEPWRAAQRNHGEN